MSKTDNIVPFMLRDDGMKDLDALVKEFPGMRPSVTGFCYTCRAWVLDFKEHTPGHNIRKLNSQEMMAATNDRIDMYN